MRNVEGGAVPDKSQQERRDQQRSRRSASRHGRELRGSRAVRQPAISGALDCALEATPSPNRPARGRLGSWLAANLAANTILVTHRALLKHTEREIAGVWRGEPMGNGAVTVPRMVEPEESPDRAT